MKKLVLGVVGAMMVGSASFAAGPNGENDNSYIMLSGVPITGDKMDNKALNALWIDQYNEDLDGPNNNDSSIALNLMGPGWRAETSAEIHLSIDFIDGYAGGWTVMTPSSVQGSLRIDVYKIGHGNGADPDNAIWSQNCSYSDLTTNTNPDSICQQGKIKISPKDGSNDDILFAGGSVVLSAISGAENQNLDGVKFSSLTFVPNYGPTITVFGSN